MDSRLHHHFTKDIQTYQKKRLFKRGGKKPSGELGLKGQITQDIKTNTFFFERTQNLL